MSGPAPRRAADASGIVLDAVRTAVDRCTGQSLADPATRRRVTWLVTNEVVQQFSDRWPEAVAGESRRVVARYTSVAWWDARAWYLSGFLARLLPRYVVSQAVKRAILEAGAADEGYDLPVLEVLRRWDVR